MQQQQQQQLAQLNAITATLVEEISFLNTKAKQGAGGRSSHMRLTAAQTCTDHALRPWRRGCCRCAIYTPSFNRLSQENSPSFKYEQVVLEPALCYLYDAVQYLDETLLILEDQDQTPVSAQTVEQQIYETDSTVMWAYILLANRYSMVQLRASLGGDASARGGGRSTESEASFHGGGGIGQKAPALQEKEGSLARGGCQRGGKRDNGSCIFLVAKACSNRWRIVYDLGWLNGPFFAVGKQLGGATASRGARAERPGAEEA
ncbi:hypothetical protein CYMTET_15661 [Cymbomonas tetramitiformis]|uniref:Uncharacterized protein n=1 Tax=Cymbomonas tetramitiformis TaxID=36881 RepID=A0AAE0L8Y0_9CHLO|nr:hypothetical protein CYMTET_15661 [Cymbomonas tetramitiformis]